LADDDVLIAGVREPVRTPVVGVPHCMKARYAGLASTVLASFLLAGCFTNPVTGRKELITTTPEQELSLGAQSFADVQKTEKVSHDPAANERVTRVGRRIAQAVGKDLPNANWEFVVFDSDQVNAFALPGGHVGVYTGLLKLATTDDELAIVLGHEIGHVTARHGAERITEAKGLALAGQLGGALLDANANTAQYQQLFNVAYGVTTNVGFTLPHSRKQESEADRMGLVYAARAGYDPRAALTFWQKMIAQQKAGAGGLLQKFLSDHPADEQRIRDIEAFLPQVIPIYEQNRGRY
jgi:predicted Zn-dependent protease